MDSLAVVYTTIIIPLWRGIYWTLLLALWGSGVSLFLGFFLGIVKSLCIPVLKHLIMLYVFLVRGTPFLLILFIIYYVLPFFRISLSPFFSAVLGLVIHEGAYMTEIVSSGLESIDRGQHESSQALGLNLYQKIRYILLPQAIKIMLPSFAGQIVLLIKATALVSLIGLTELTRMGRLLTQRGENPFFIFGLVAVFYFVICYPVINIADKLERKSTIDT